MKYRYGGLSLLDVTIRWQKSDGSGPSGPEQSQNFLEVVEVVDSTVPLAVS